MTYHIYKVLNIKPAESHVVKQLFLIQLFLGVATSFLFTSALVFFLHAFEVKYIPRVYLGAAVMLLIANVVYAKLEHAFSSRKLLEIIILFSAGSLLLTWAVFTFINNKWLPLFLSAWNVVVYMLVGYAFWGMVAMVFNVRESKRIFSLVGAGDLPAKLLGYGLVPVLIPYIGVDNLLWFSVLAFAGAYLLLRKFRHKATDSALQEHQHQHQHHKTRHASLSHPVKRLFHNELIFSIALFSFIGFIIYALIDYTLLGEVKSRFPDVPDLAVFISVFFAVGRVLAIFFKVFLSSRVISQLGLTNALLLSPVLLLGVTGLLLLPGESEIGVLYTFGIMVLLSEVLKSVVQEPTFFILFQPLEPHLRLKGHLIAKGYMLPLALLCGGVFLIVCDTWGNGVSIVLISKVLLGLLLAWAILVYFINRSYLRTLILSIRKGWFTGAELFLTDAAVKDLLVQKVRSDNPKEVVVALELLEQSGYKDFNKLLLDQFGSAPHEVKKFVLESLLRRQAKEALPLVEEQLHSNNNSTLRQDLLRAYFQLAPLHLLYEQLTNNYLAGEDKKYALMGLLLRDEPEAHQLVLQEMEVLVNESSSETDKLLALAVISSAPKPIFSSILDVLLTTGSDAVCKQAIPIIGKAKMHSLLEKAVATATARNAYYALQQALVQFGDDAFAADFLKSQHLPKAAVDAAIVAAGKVKGEKSTKFLLRLLAHNWQRSRKVVGSLWLKQDTLLPEDQQVVKHWIKTKLLNCRHKIKAYHAISHNSKLQLLSDALWREVKQDIQKVLQALALCYNRQRIDRVEKLLQLRDITKAANAIEILEHSIPKHLFKEVDKVLSFVLDPQPTMALLSVDSEPEVKSVLAHILQDERTNCSVWCKAMACFTVADFPDDDLLQLLHENKGLPPEPLFQQSRDYVLRTIKSKSYAAH